MKFLLLDKYKLMIHTVNSDQEESLLINYDNRNLDSTKIISLEKENSEWYVKSNGIVIVFNNGVELDKYKLSPNTICQLKILGSDEELFIYAETLTEKEIKSFTYSTLETLTLGKGEKNIIQYNYPLVKNNYQNVILNKKLSGFTGSFSLFLFFITYFPIAYCMGESDVSDGLCICKIHLIYIAV